MKEHYTQRTIEAQTWCNKCNKATMHRVDKGRKGPCLVCLAALEKKHAELALLKPVSKLAEEQMDLFRKS